MFSLLRLSFSSSSSVPFTVSYFIHTLCSPLASPILRHPCTCLTFIYLPMHSPPLYSVALLLLPFSSLSVLFTVSYFIHTPWSPFASPPIPHYPRTCLTSHNLPTRLPVYRAVSFPFPHARAPSPDPSTSIHPPSGRSLRLRHSFRAM